MVSVPGVSIGIAITIGIGIECSKMKPAMNTSDTRRDSG
jgi:hypothetical protein